MPSKCLLGTETSWPTPAIRYPTLDSWYTPLLGLKPEKGYRVAQRPPTEYARLASARK